jgi:hypothetical protein
MCSKYIFFQFYSWAPPPFQSKSLPKIPPMEGIRVGIHDISSQIDSHGNEYIIYNIDVTVASPFHGWNISRRYTDFVNLFKYMTTKSSPRILSCSIPSSSSTSSHFLSLLSPKSLAMKRKQRLQDYLTALITSKDLSSQEIHILKVFLDFEQYEIFLDMYRNRSHKMVTTSDIERSLLNIENITQVSRVLFLERNEAPQRQPQGDGGNGSFAEEHHDLCQLMQSNLSTVSSNIEIDRLCYLPSPPPPDPEDSSAVDDTSTPSAAGGATASGGPPQLSSSPSTPWSSPGHHHRNRSGTGCSEELDQEQSAIWRTVPDELTTDSAPQTPPVKLKRDSKDFTPPHSSASKATPPPSASSSAAQQPSSASRHFLSTSASSPSLSSPPLSTVTPTRSPLSSSTATLTTRSISLCSSSGFSYPPTSDGLKEAIRNNDLKIIKQILQTNPALASFCDSQGHPLIYTCALFNNIPIALLLIDYGADPYVINLNGLSAIEIATVQWKTIVLERFLQKKNLLERKSLLSSASQNRIVKGNLRKTVSGIGLKLGKNPNGKAMILGFTSPAKRIPGNSRAGEENPEPSPIEFLRVCDLIHLIDGKEMKDLNEVIRKVKETEVNDLLEITVLRSASVMSPAPAPPPASASDGEEDRERSRIISKSSSGGG